MTVSQLAELVSAKTVNEADFDRQITAVYAGDLLSHVMGKAPEGCAWLTVMTNVNVAAVAVLTDAAVVVLCEGCRADDALRARAEQQGINILSTELGIVEVAVRVSNAC